MKKFLFAYLISLILIFNSGINAQPLPPVLVSPTNHATCISLYPTFNWNVSSGATSYRIQIFQGAYMVFDQSNITSTTFSLVSSVLDYNLEYYWHVNATNGGGTSNWSTSWYFTTMDPLPIKPYLVTPPDSAVVSLTPTLTWNDSTSVSSYRLQVSTNSGFSTTVIDVQGLANSSYLVQPGQLSNGVTYYWRTNANNSCQAPSDWSNPRNFTTQQGVLSPPILQLPANGATGVSLTPTLDWSDVTGATGYEVQISLNNTFQSLVLDESPVASQWIVDQGVLSGSQLYFWRVCTINSGGNGPWASYFSFTTQVGPPARPILTNPLDSAIGVSLTPTLAWNPVPNNNSYRVQVSADAGFGSTIVNQVTGNTPQYVVPNGLLTNNTFYYWRVNAENSGGTSAWSNVFHFTTVVGVPPAPSLISPSNNASGISLTPMFIWSDVSVATKYRLQISVNTTFTSLVYDNQNITNDTFNLPGGILIGTTNYYWRVAAINAGGQGAWSTPYFQFMTMQSFTLNLKVYLEGFYNGTTQTQIQDTVRVYLAQATSPFTFKDSTTYFLGSNGSSTVGFTRAVNGYYYIVVKHRNHLETWSYLAVSFSTGSPVNYNFTDTSIKAYGNNMKKVGSAYVLYGGDANQDGLINPYDYTIFETQFGLSGYQVCDFNGDGFVDGLDAIYILQPNFGITLARPY
jgi:hypothetical protein